MRWNPSSGHIGNITPIINTSCSNIIHSESYQYFTSLRYLKNFRSPNYFFDVSYYVLCEGLHPMLNSFIATKSFRVMYE